MITAGHVLLFSPDAEAARAFFRDVLQLHSVDAGEGWLIFRLPPAELGVHPSEGALHTELYLMCDDINRTVEELRGRGAEFVDGIKEEGFGLVTYVKLPGGGQLGIYEPRHPLAV